MPFASSLLHWDIRKTIVIIAKEREEKELTCITGHHRGAYNAKQNAKPNRKTQKRLRTSPSHQTRASRRELRLAKSKLIENTFYFSLEKKTKPEEFVM